MDMNKVDATTPATEFSWIRACVYGAIMMVAWVVITLLIRMLTSWEDRVTTPGIGFGIAMGIAFEYIRRGDARKKQR
ncbi:hypothetical protein [Arsenicicoccus sp. oral taxon 190]|uniref:hypothetical protein n=1 Tax=Arsenicicoccus sp. oral taxon 190 TaxID=1658671 RepID=UPI00067A432C|nr:hypothetical protein [Arsenicicoccus sp. oral taxon 190]AKT52424.1 hypothetical protein ADJ73_16180 [Arsenicicoccus sp. oral taxon 190]